jgi:hypothetical protein
MSDVSRTNQLKKHLKLVNSLSDSELEEAVEYAVIETAALGLLKRWFPTKVPTDIEKWSEIAYEDVHAVLTALKDEGYLIKFERTNDNDTSNS